MKKHLFLLYLGLSFFAIGSCNSSNNSMTKEYEGTPTLTSLQTRIGSTNGDSMSSIPATLEPTHTLDPFFTPAPIQMLGDNKCLLPCWQEITPGTSSIIELDATVQVLLGMSLSPKSSVFQGQEYLATNAYKEFSIQGTEIYFSVGTFSQSNQSIVEALHIWADVIGYQELDNSKGHFSYWQLFKDYGLQSVLSTYGIPEKILIFGEMYHEESLYDRDALHLRLLYPTKGIYISYDMPSKRNEGKGTACPSEADFSLWLTSPESSQYYESWWESSQGYTNFSTTFDTPVEEALGMNTESFFETFSKDNAPCITTPVEIWLP